MTGTASTCSGRNTPPDRISARLGTDWDGGGSRIETSDAVCLLVFTRAGAVVAWTDHPRSHGDLAPLAGRDFARPDATLRTTTSNGWIKLVE